jgi:hypothetical protein
MSSQLSDALVVLGVIAGLVGVAGFVGALIAYARFKGLESSMAMMKSANDELRSELQDEREKRANLQGQVDVLVGDLANRIVHAVTAALSSSRAGLRDPSSRTRATDDMTEL